MTTERTEQARKAALAAFLKTFSEQDLLDELGPKRLCAECEALANLLHVHGRKVSAQILRESHAREDEDDDMPEHVELRDKLEDEE